MTTEKGDAAHQSPAACEPDHDLQHWWRVISVLLDVPPARHADPLKRRMKEDGKQTRRRRSRQRTN